MSEPPANGGGQAAERGSLAECLERHSPMHRRTPPRPAVHQGHATHSPRRLHQVLLPPSRSAASDDQTTSRRVAVQADAGKVMDVEVYASARRGRPRTTRHTSAAKPTIYMSSVAAAGSTEALASQVQQLQARVELCRLGASTSVTGGRGRDSQVSAHSSGCGRLSPPRENVGKVLATRVAFDSGI